MTMIDLLQSQWENLRGLLMFCPTAAYRPGAILGGLDIHQDDTPMFHVER